MATTKVGSSFIHVLNGCEGSLCKTRNQEPGTWNMEHSTFRNIPEHQIIMIITRKICKIKFSKTEKAGNAETT